eukprot:scaffold1421_cov62-Cylindrotheca_fusiformis.AAC.1
MTDVTSVYITVNDEDDECFEVCSEESNASFCLADKNNNKPAAAAAAAIRSPSEQQRMDFKRFTVSAEDYSSAFVLELPRIQPTVSDLTCFLDILSFSKQNEEEEDEETRKKKKGSRIIRRNRGIYRPLPQAIDARGNIVPQESSAWTRKKNYKPRTASETIRTSEQEEQQETSVLPFRKGEERKPKRCNSLSSIASSTPSTTCHYLAESVMERRLSISSSVGTTSSRNNDKTKKNIDAAASCAVSTTTLAARRPSTRARPSRPRIKQSDKHHSKSSSSDSINRPHLEPSKLSTIMAREDYTKIESQRDCH